MEDKLYTFNSLFIQILDQHVPLKTVKLRTQPTPFIDDNIRALVKTRNYWQKLARQTNDPAAWSGYMNAATFQRNQPTVLNSQLQNNLHLLKFIIQTLKGLCCNWPQTKRLELRSYQLVSSKTLHLLSFLL